MEREGERRKEARGRMGKGEDRKGRREKGADRRGEIGGRGDRKGREEIRVENMKDEEGY